MRNTPCRIHWCVALAEPSGQCKAHEREDERILKTYPYSNAGEVEYRRYKPRVSRLLEKLYEEAASA